METQHSTSRFPPEASLYGSAPHTPPYTPNLSKNRFERSDSPASVHSIQPTETISPAKKAEQQFVQDNIKVEELTEADLGYIADVDLVYPEELEEVESDSKEENTSSESDGASDTGISQHFSRLDCEDGAEAEFQRMRRAKHVRRRTNSRVFKRSHAQSVKSDTEMSDSDAMGDQDRSSSARRLRRRIRGPNGVEVIYDDASRGSPPPKRPSAAFGTLDGWQGPAYAASNTGTSNATDGMEVDGSD